MILLRWAFGPLGRIQAGTDLTNNFTQLKVIKISTNFPEKSTLTIISFHL